MLKSFRHADEPIGFGRSKCVYSGSFSSAIQTDIFSRRLRLENLFETEEGELVLGYEWVEKNRIWMKAYSPLGIGQHSCGVRPNHRWKVHRVLESKLRTKDLLLFNINQETSLNQFYFHFLRSKQLLFLSDLKLLNGSDQIYLQFESQLSFCCGGAHLLFILCLQTG